MTRLHGLAPLLRRHVDQMDSAAAFRAGCNDNNLP